MLTLVCTSVSGVFAFWQYSHLSPDAAGGGLTSGMSIFDYPPEEIVPGVVSRAVDVNSWRTINK
jgi:hypothetical protein